LVGGNMAVSKEKPESNSNPYGLSEKDTKWMRNSALQQLKGSRVEGAGGVWIHTPDGVGNYKALWTRDYYYMVEYAGDLLDPEEIKASINYLINRQREDGCIPDRVNIAGKAIYSPGGPNKPMADHAVDNAPFMAMLVCSYVNQFNDEELFKELEPKLLKGLEHIYVKENGLVYNNPKKPECVY
jgi:glycogen debranching enzyme